MIYPAYPACDQNDADNEDDDDYFHFSVNFWRLIFTLMILMLIFNEKILMKMIMIIVFMMMITMKMILKGLWLRL